MGFEQSAAQQALNMYNGNEEAAVNYLLGGGGGAGSTTGTAAAAPAALRQGRQGVQPQQNSRAPTAFCKHKKPTAKPVKLQ